VVVDTDEWVLVETRSVDEDGGEIAPDDGFLNSMVVRQRKRDE
jgi:hypothetical protein